MKIKKFDQLFEAFNDSHFTITDNDIEDICTEITDIGFKLTIKKRYINGGKGKSITDEPLTPETSPLYEIELDKESDEEKPIEYWNGGLYFQDVKWFRCDGFDGLLKFLEDKMSEFRNNTNIS